MPFLTSNTLSARRCGLPMAFFAAGTMTLLALGFVAADAQDAKPAAETAQVTMSDGQRAEIEKIVKEYLLANPEVLLDAQRALEEKMEKLQAEKTQAALKENADDILNSPTAPVAGNPKGDVTVVEFFDYNCGYCRRSFEEIASVIKKDENVRFVFKELPIIDPSASPGAAKVALAADKQGKYLEIHRALMEGQGSASEQTALAKAKSLGLDMDKLKADMAAPEIQKELDRVLELAKKLNVGGTPFFLVGDHIVAGGYDNLGELLLKHVKDVRKSGCSYC